MPPGSKGLHETLPILPVVVFVAILGLADYGFSQFSPSASSTALTAAAAETPSHSENPDANKGQDVTLSGTGKVESDKPSGDNQTEVHYTDQNGHEQTLVVPADSTQAFGNDQPPSPIEPQISNTVAQSAGMQSLGGWGSAEMSGIEPFGPNFDVSSYSGGASLPNEAGFGTLGQSTAGFENAGYNLPLNYYETSGPTPEGFNSGFNSLDSLPGYVNDVQNFPPTGPSNSVTLPGDQGYQAGSPLNDLFGNNVVPSGYQGSQSGPGSSIQGYVNGSNSYQGSQTAGGSQSGGYAQQQAAPMPSYPSTPQNIGPCSGCSIPQSYYNNGPTSINPGQETQYPSNNPGQETQDGYQEGATYVNPNGQTVIQQSSAPSLGSIPGTGGGVTSTFSPLSPTPIANQGGLVNGTGFTEPQPEVPPSNYLFPVEPVPLPYEPSPYTPENPYVEPLLPGQNPWVTPLLETPIGQGNQTGAPLTQLFQGSTYNGQGTQIGTPLGNYIQNSNSYQGSQQGLPITWGAVLYNLTHEFSNLIP